MLRKEAEEELTEDDQQRGHLTLGKIGDYVYTLPFDGALLDVANKLNMVEALAEYGKWMNQRGDFSTPFTKVAMAPLDYAVGGMNPLLKGAMELSLGKQFYPSITDPRTIHDRILHIQRTLSLDRPIELLANITETVSGGAVELGRPSRGLGINLLDIVIDNRDTRYGSYLKTRAIGYDWRDHVTDQGGAPAYTSARSKILRNMALALKYKDDGAYRRYRAHAREAGIKSKDIQAWRKRQHPTGMLPQKLRGKFLQHLRENPDDWSDYERAVRYWRSTFMNPANRNLTNRDG